MCYFNSMVFLNCPSNPNMNIVLILRMMKLTGQFRDSLRITLLVANKGKNDYPLCWLLFSATPQCLALFIYLLMDFFTSIFYLILKIFFFLFKLKKFVVPVQLSPFSCHYFPHLPPSLALKQKMLKGHLLLC